MKIFKKLGIVLLGAMLACSLFVSCSLNKAKVTYMVDGVPYSVQEYEYEADVKLPAPPTKAGHTFVGWYTDEALTQPYTVESIVSSFTLYAKFTASTLYITILDGGELVESVAVTPGNAYELPTLTKEGYTFEGYEYLNANGQKDPFPTSGTFGNDASIQVWPKYTINKYTVTFVGETGETKLENIEYNTKVTAPAQDKAGYDLVGWYTSETTQDETTKFDFAQGVKDNVTLYAKYSPKTFTITVNGAQVGYENPTVKYGEEYTIETPDRGSNYIFKGYTYGDEEFLATGTYVWTEDIAIEVVWEGAGRDIYFYDGTKELTDLRVEGEYGANIADLEIPEVPAKTGYDKDENWYVDAACTEVFEQTGELLTNIRLYAKYTAIEYTLTFVVYQKPIKADSQKNVEIKAMFDQTFEAPEKATSDTYDFVGYYYKNGEEKVAFDASAKYAIADNLTIYEEWKLSPNATLLQKNEEHNSSFQEREDYSDDWTYVYLVGYSYGFTNTTVKVITESDEEYVTVIDNGTKLSCLKATEGTITVQFTPQDGESYERTIKIVESVRTFNVGVSYSNAWMSYNKNDWKKQEQNESMTVGRTNYVPDLVIKNINDEVLNISQANIEVSVINADTSEIVEDYTVENGAINFGNGDTVKDGTNLAVTIAPKYATNITHTATFNITLNSGVNVYTNAELKTVYADTMVSEINILRSFKAELSSDEVYTIATDDEWTNGEYSGTVVKGFVAPYNKLDKDENDVGGNGVYERLSGDLTVNGNYFSIDGSGLPLVDGRANPKEGGFLGNSADYLGQNVHFGIFMFGQNGKFIKDELTMNNLLLTGNYTGLTYDIAYVTNGKQVLKYSGACIGTHVRNANLVMNNVTTRNCAFAANAYGDLEDDANGTNTQSATMTLTDCLFDNSWSNNIYVLGPCKVSITSSYIGNACGASIHFDSRPDKGTAECELVLDNETQIENWVVGDESWFTLYSANSTVTELKTQINGGVVSGSAAAISNGVPNAKNRTILKKVDGKELVNFAILMKSVGEKTDWPYENGKTVYSPLVINFGCFEPLKLQAGDSSQLGSIMSNYALVGREEAVGFNYLEIFVGIIDA